MKAFISCFPLATVLLCGCEKWQRTEIQDPSKPAVLQLAADHLPSSVHLRVRGQIDAEATIWGDYLDTNRMHGRFEVNYQREYYNTNLELHYCPEGVRTGYVRIQYVFK